MRSARHLWARYKLRLRRKRLLWRAFTKRRELKSVSRNVEAIRPGQILLFATVRNEMQRLPHFIEHYRRLGVGHFLFVDNNSDDGTTEFLAKLPDVSLWHTPASYKASRFGMDWLTALHWRFGSDHWTLTVDADELFIYPDWEMRDLHELTLWLDRHDSSTMGAMMLDLYPKGSLSETKHTSGQNPLDVLKWFDAYGYWAQLQQKMGNLWMQGGPRARHFFSQTPERSPTLNKIPLVKWQKPFVYVNSTHNALPASLNQTYDHAGVEKICGILLHTKFLPDAPERAEIETHRREHFANPDAYADYYATLSEDPSLWTEESVQFKDAQQLERLGLMHRGTWPD